MPPLAELTTLGSQSRLPSAPIDLPKARPKNRAAPPHVFETHEWHTQHEAEWDKHVLTWPTSPTTWEWWEDWKVKVVVVGGAQPHVATKFGCCDTLPYIAVNGSKWFVRIMIGPFDRHLYVLLHINLWHKIALFDCKKNT